MSNAEAAGSRKEDYCAERKPESELVGDRNRIGLHSEASGELRGALSCEQREAVSERKVRRFGRARGVGLCGAVQAAGCEGSASALQEQVLMAGASHLCA